MGRMNAGPAGRLRRCAWRLRRARHLSGSIDQTLSAATLNPITNLWERAAHAQTQPSPPSGLHHNPAYSHVVTAAGARTIYISGQVSVDEEGRIVGEGDLAAQTTQVMQNLGLALKAAGATYANIVKITTFVVNYKPELRPIIGKARSAFFEGMEPPASTLVGVSALAAPEWLIEIEAIAVAD